jgi:hypothetical protein
MSDRGKTGGGPKLAAVQRESRSLRAALQEPLGAISEVFFPR